jgi:hypothetical protein
MIIILFEEFDRLMGRENGEDVVDGGTVADGRYEADKEVADSGTVRNARYDVDEEVVD